MNKPAPKEPSMDEILSSIRQIIADDDAGRRPSTPMPSFAQATAWPPANAVSVVPREAVGDEATLALTSEQIVTDDEPLDVPDLTFAHPVGDDEMDSEEASAELVDPDDIAFDGGEVRSEPAPAAAPTYTAPPVRPNVAPFAERLRPRVADAAPMPDPRLSADLAEELLEPTTNAAVRGTFSRLHNLGIGAPGLTIEAMMREMLRPMLKEWLDENLPTVVERMVEKEIARISRGID